MELISSMTIMEFIEYIKYLSDELIKEQKEKQEENLFQVWLHKEWEKSFKDFKGEILKKAKKKNIKMTKKEETESINKAERILGRR